MKTGLQLSQVLASNSTVHLSPGDQFILVLPSGRRVRIEVMQDMTCIELRLSMRDEAVPLLQEERRQGTWDLDCPVV